MNATIRTKSHFMFEEQISGVRIEIGDPSYIASGVIEVSDSLLKQIQNDAHQFGSWEAAMQIKLTAEIDGRYIEHEIQLKDLPVSNSIYFITTNV